MSNNDTIYLSTGLSPEESGRRIARALGLSVWTDADGAQVVREDDAGPVAGGLVSANVDHIHRPDDHTPAEDSVIDGYDIQWDIRSTGDRESLNRASRALFDQVVERLPWPALLVQSNYQFLVAAFRPGRPVVEFPADTSPDAPSRELWAPFELPWGGPPPAG